MNKLRSAFSGSGLLPVILAILLALGLVVSFLLRQHQVQSQLLAEQQQIALDTAYRAITEVIRKEVERAECPRRKRIQK